MPIIKFAITILVSLTLVTGSSAQVLACKNRNQIFVLTALSAKTENSNLDVQHDFKTSQEFLLRKAECFILENGETVELADRNNIDANDQYGQVFSKQKNLSLWLELDGLVKLNVIRKESSE